MKKRILVNTHYMPVGGAERALLGLLHSIDYDKYSVDLMINRHEGELMRYIPGKVNVLPEIKEYGLVLGSLTEVVKSHCYKIAAAKILARFKHFVYRLFHRRKRLYHGGYADDFTAFDILWKTAVRHLPAIPLSRNYDAAISFLMPHYVVAEKISAATKIAWIHTDYSSVELNRNSEAEVWGKFDKIVAISEKTKDQFLSVFPEFKDKMAVIHNISNAESVKLQAQRFYPEEYSENVLKILSVGRICNAKNFEVIPDVAKLLKMADCKFVWYILGPGDASGLIRKIRETDTADVIKVLPPCDNPYPYIANADIYVQPSLYEGNCVTVEEAKILRRPIVVTPYNSATAQIENDVTGVIAAGFEPEQICDAVSKLINNVGLRQKILLNLSNACAGNEREINKFYELIE